MLLIVFFFASSAFTLPLEAKQRELLDRFMKLGGQKEGVVHSVAAVRRQEQSEVVVEKNYAEICQHYGLAPTDPATKDVLARWQKLGYHSTTKPNKAAWVCSMLEAAPVQHTIPIAPIPVQIRCFVGPFVSENAIDPPGGHGLRQRPGMSKRQPPLPPALGLF